MRNGGRRLLLLSNHAASHSNEANNQLVEIDTELVGSAQRGSARPHLASTRALFAEQRSLIFPRGGGLDGPYLAIVRSEGGSLWLWLLVGCL